MGNLPILYRVPQGTIHFPNLNGLRFIAALLVIIHHVAQMRYALHMPSLWENPTIKAFGPQGVGLFFVLSGFLITYLLLAEQAKFGRLAIGKFYLRRALRIWPLYYFVVLLGLVIMPRLAFFNMGGLLGDALSHLPQKAALFGLILPNVALTLYPGVMYLSQAWSIGTEEQFYLFWPWVVRAAGKRVLPGLIGTALFFILIKRVVSGAYHAAGPQPGEGIAFCYRFFLEYFRIDCMAIGSVLAAVLFLRRDRWLRWLMARPTQWAALLGVVALLASGRYIPLREELYSLLFGIIILNLAAATRPVIRLEYRWLNFLGKISYGLYMLHTVAVIAVLRTIAPRLDALGWAAGQILSVCAVVALTVALAAISYYGMEKPFLRLKEAFIRIRSQPDAVVEPAA